MEMQRKIMKFAVCEIKCKLFSNFTPFFFMSQIRVNCINPAVTKTDLAMNQAGWSKPEKAKPILDKIPLHRFAG